MSDYYTKIIPANPFHRPGVERLQEAAACLLDRLAAMEVKVNRSDTPAFIDCGGLLEAIRCPHCGADLFDWWSEQMDALYNGGGFPRLAVTLPCCGRESSLDRLIYKAPCGFACVEISLLYPRAQPDEDCLAHLRQLLGCGIQVIHSRI